MKPLVIFIIFSAFLKSYSQKNDTAQKLIYDTNYIAIIPFDYKEFYGELDNTNVPSTLSQSDIDVIEKIFFQSIAEHDSALKGDSKKYYSIDLNQWNYRRQYVCYTTKKGEKIVYVDCFCAIVNKDRHKQMASVEDGGKCFFNLKINLTTKKYFDFYVNGSA
jgi:hypothetical protein